MNPQLIYQTLCLAADPAASIRRWHSCTLAAMASYLSAHDHASGIPGIILGMIVTEAADRWLEEHQYHTGAVGEGDPL